MFFVLSKTVGFLLLPSNFLLLLALAGAALPKLSSAFGEPVFSGSGSRMLAMAKLARAYPNARIVYSGGDASLFGDGVRETDFVYPALESLGIARERVQLETQSRNTDENAAFTKLMMKPKPGERWLLVTSARHMPRAIGCFRKADFHVEAYPVGWRAAGALDPQWERGVADGLERLDAAAYEWIGLLAYRLSGKTAELFPSP